MKLHFEPNLDYQLAAIEAVCDLFRGQEICRSEFTVTLDPTDRQQRLAYAQHDLGVCPSIRTALETSSGGRYRAVCWGVHCV